MFGGDLKKKKTTRGRSEIEKRKRRKHTDKEILGPLHGEIGAER